MRLQLRKGVRQHCAVMRHGVVGKTEKDAVEFFRRSKFTAAGLRQRDILPAVPGAEIARMRQHLSRQVHAVNMSGRTYGFTQERKIASCAATDFQHVIAWLDLERRCRT